MAERTPRSPLGSLRTGVRFLGEARRTFTTTGMVAPSSRYLARAMTHPVLPPPGRARRVLEVGPGTGVMTRELLAALGPGDHLDVVEINPNFARAVRELVAASTGGASVRVHECAVQDAGLMRPYDAAVCPLPFTNFAPATVEAILRQLIGLLGPGARMSVVGYLGTLRLRQLLTPAAAAEHAAAQHVVEDYYRRYGSGERIVTANLPPARVRLLTAPS